MAILGSLIGGMLGAYGKKPVIPALPNIDPNKVQQQTIAGNQASAAGAEGIASNLNKFNLDELAKALSFWSPGSLQQIQGTIGAQLGGQLDPEDTRSIIRNATAAGYGKGFGFGVGSIGRNLVARDLGTSVEAQRQRGLGNLMSLYQAGPKPYDASSMFYTPQQRLDFALSDRTQHYQRDLLAAQVEAAPDPATAALGREIDRFFNTAASIGTMAAGNATGG